jgi:VWFA-related protein
MLVSSYNFGLSFDRILESISSPLFKRSSPMNRLSFSLLLSMLLLVASVAQTPQRQKPAQEDLTVRIGTKLVQIDVAVIDKNDQVVRDLKLDNFELYEDGKKQQLQFIEFVDAQTGRRVRDSHNPQTTASETPSSPSPTGASLKRVIAFVVDDLTIPKQDMITVRQMLTNFVERQMAPGDLVSIVRSVGGRGLFEQFTSDRDLLRRAISMLTPVTHPFALYNGLESDRVNPAALAGAEAGGAAITNVDIDTGTDDTNQTLRALMSLSTSSFVVDSLRDLPGRKTLVLISGGLPLFSGMSGTITGNVSTFFRQLADHAARSGVVINTMDIRGLKSVRAVANFTDTPGKGALSPGSGAGGFGRIPDPAISPSAPLEEHLGLRTLSNSTGGLAVLYTNDFETGLSKVLSRSKRRFKANENHRISKRIAPESHRHQARDRS